MPANDNGGPAVVLDALQGVNSHPVIEVFDRGRSYFYGRTQSTKGRVGNHRIKPMLVVGREGLGGVLIGHGRVPLGGQITKAQFVYFIDRHSCRVGINDQ